MPALLYGFFACYAVTGKCDLRIDKEGRDIPVFTSLAECQRFGSRATRAAPDKQGKWALDEGHYYQCFGLGPESTSAPALAASPPPAPPAAPAPPSRPVYKTTAEALQRDFQSDPNALTQKIGKAIVQVSGTVVETGVAEGAALLLSGDSWDVTAWLTPGGMAAARGLSKHQRVTLLCDRIGTLVAGSRRRPGVVELHDCSPVSP